MSKSDSEGRGIDWSRNVKRDDRGGVVARWLPNSIVNFVPICKSAGKPDGKVVSEDRTR